METYGIVVSIFSVSDQDSRKRFFQKSFLLADVKPKIVLAMPFLIISNVDVNFQAQDLQWRSYTTGDILPTTKRVELLGKKKFVTTALDSEHEVFIIHIAALSLNPDDGVHPLRRAQIAYLKADEALIEVLSEYTDFVDIFSPKLGTPKTRNQQPCHRVNG